MPRLLSSTYQPANALQTLRQLKLESYCSNELRNYLQKVHHQLKEWFLQGADTEFILKLQTQIIDDVLKQVWQQQDWDDHEQIALLAVGGYGRKALHPHSDIDITIVLADKIIENAEYLNKIQKFMACLWDSKLKLGHSVRSLRQSIQQAEQDLPTFTSLLESRLLYGSEDLAQQLSDSIYNLCSKQHFIHLKYEEFKERYNKYSNPPYTLEPDIKHSPGGLRDIQLIEWLINFIYKTKEPESHLGKLFIPEEEQEWSSAKKYLNTIRCARHLLSNHHTGDQLIFDCQLSIGELFESDTQKKNNAIVSDFMRTYFFHARAIERLTHRGLQLLHAFAAPPSFSDLNHPYIKIEEGEIKFSQSEIVVTEPWRLFEIFALLSEHQEAFQLSVGAQRLIEKYRSLIPNNIHTQPQYQSLFLRILRSPKISNTLELLHQYGLFGKYITEFIPITGMMQYDLFHSYPVDQHTLFLVKNLSDFTHHPNTLLFPLAASAIKQISKPEVLYLASIFHDIGKGRGGEHEEIGAVFIRQFAEAHHYSAEDIELMSWLVKEHLLLSHTAQHQDITNPAIIEEFSAKLNRNSNNLNHLYLLTVADIYATNNKLWTAWRSSLIDTLYRETTHVLQASSHPPKKIEDIIAEKQKEALELIKDMVQKNEIIQLWSQFDPDYFLSRTPQELIQQADFILTTTTLPIINVAQHYSKSATEIFIYTQQHAELFLAITTLLSKLQLSIVAADVNTTTSAYNLGTYIVLQRDNQPLDNETHIERVIQRLKDQLAHIEQIQTPELKHLSTRLQALDFPTLIEFAANTHTECTMMSLYTPDRPGLLAHIAEVCYKQHIQIHRAQINTLGERAEDIFWLLNILNQPLTTNEQKNLREKLVEVLSI